MYTINYYYDTLLMNLLVSPVGDLLVVPIPISASADAITNIAMATVIPIMTSDLVTPDVSVLLPLEGST